MHPIGGRDGTRALGGDRGDAVRGRWSWGSRAARPDGPPDRSAMRVAVAGSVDIDLMPADARVLLLAVGSARGGVERRSLRILEQDERSDQGEDPGYAFLEQRSAGAEHVFAKLLWPPDGSDRKSRFQAAQRHLHAILQPCADRAAQTAGRVRVRSGEVG